MNFNELEHFLQLNTFYQFKSIEFSNRLPEATSKSKCKKKQSTNILIIFHCTKYTAWYGVSNLKYRYRRLNLFNIWPGINTIKWDFIKKKQRKDSTKITKTWKWKQMQNDRSLITAANRKQETMCLGKLSPQFLS